MIAVIDYGVGNLRSVERAFIALGFKVRLTSSVSEILDSRGIVIPGVGSFGKGVTSLRRLGLCDAIRELADSIPILGICLGMQMLFEWSPEGGSHEGLGLLQGKAISFGGDLKVPHMGWNRVEFLGDHPLLDGVADGGYFYFAHSFRVHPADEAVVVGRTDYGGFFPSVVCRGNIMGVQFHPEKSGRLGLKVLGNFGVMACGGHSGD